MYIVVRELKYLYSLRKAGEKLGEIGFLFSKLKTSIFQQCIYIVVDIVQII